MPVKREGRFTVADPAEVQAWLGQQSHMPKPAHILTGDADIAAAQRVDLSCEAEEVINVRTLQTSHGLVVEDKVFLASVFDSTWPRTSYCTHGCGRRVTNFNQKASCHHSSAA